MHERLTRGLATGVAALLLATLLPTLSAAQEQTASARFRVLVPNFWPAEGGNKKLGEKIAEELRDRINDFPTHSPIDKKELKDVLKRNRIDEDDLDCIKARQLANIANAAVVVCGYVKPATGKDATVTAQFIDAQTSETFDVQEITVGEKGEKEAADHISTFFRTLVEQQRYAQFCAEYAQSQQWESAEENCTRAIELNPNGVGSLYTRGFVYNSQDRYEDAMRDFRQVLEKNPIHENALLAAGYAAVKLGNAEEARGFYNDYLELSPGNVQVRMKVAFDMAQAGDPYGAMQVIKAGLDIESDNADLLEQYARYAIVAASAVGGSDASVITDEQRTLLEEGLNAYAKVLPMRGTEANVTDIRNRIAALQQLDRLPEAISAAEDALKTHGDEAQLWSLYADVLKRADRLDDALTALDRVASIDSAYPNLLARRGLWLMEADRTDEAIPALRTAVESGEQNGDAIANMLFSQGYRGGVQEQNFGKAIQLFDHAMTFAQSTEVKNQVGFWNGYARYKMGEAIGKPQTLETAQRALPYFQRALELFQAHRGYQQQQNVNIDQYITNSNTFIEIQEAIIKRGR
ncbi:MAG: tetratricopeptide repeat protein [Gemmatimonadota bacterium]